MIYTILHCNLDNMQERGYLGINSNVMSLVFISMFLCYIYLSCYLTLTFPGISDNE